MTFKLDFNKLRDPAHLEKMRKEREAESARLEAHEMKLRGWLNVALDRYDHLDEREREFIRNCRTRVYRYQPLSEAQEKWLGDLAHRFTQQDLPAALPPTAESGRPFSSLARFAAFSRPQVAVEPLVSVEGGPSEGECVAMTGDEATRLGYRRVSNRYCTVSRVDTPHWRERMGLKPGSDEYSKADPDLYRRVYSKDTLVLKPEEYQKVPTSGSDRTGFIPVPPTTLADTGSESSPFDDEASEEPTDYGRPRG